MQKSTLSALPPGDPEFWIARLARLHAPAQLVANLTGLSKDVVGRIFLETTGHPASFAPIESTPAAWFLANARRRFHGAMFLTLYGVTAKKFDHCASLANAYYHYASMTAGGRDAADDSEPAFAALERDYVISFARANELVDLVIRRAPAGVGQPSLNVRKCILCDSAFIDDAGGQGLRACPICQEDLAAKGE
jgi:hypothetical protein